MNNSRREFLKKAGLGTLGLLALSVVPEELLAQTGSEKLCILHTNDWHSRIDPFPANAGQNAGKGGAARRVALLKKIREQEKQVVLLDAGDIFQGTPYFNFFGGSLELELMTQMGYDVATLGNHDFDNGLDGLNKVLPKAGFPYVSANYDFKDTVLAGKIQPWKILRRGNLKIGVFGLGIDPAGLIPDKLFGATQYQEPIIVANKIATYLRKEEKCDLVICLSHLGYAYADKKVSDQVLATETEHIDFILGGHTHTFLAQPVELRNKAGKPVVINQVGWAGIMLGRIDVVFQPSTRDFAYSACSVTIS